jgi:hypothetical protein
MAPLQEYQRRRWRRTSSLAIAAASNEFEACLVLSLYVSTYGQPSTAEPEALNIS